MCLSTKKIISKNLFEKNFFIKIKNSPREKCFDETEEINHQSYQIHGEVQKNKTKNYQFWFSWSQWIFFWQKKFKDESSNKNISHPFWLNYIILFCNCELIWLLFKSSKYKRLTFCIISTLNLNPQFRYLSKKRLKNQFQFT